MQFGDEYTGDDRRQVRLCQSCAEDVDALQAETPSAFLDYKGYWIFEETLRFGDRHLPHVEYLVIDPRTRQEMDRCQSLQDARDSIDELTNFYGGLEDE